MATNGLDTPSTELLVVLKYISLYVPEFSIDVSENFKHTLLEPSEKTSGRNFTLHADVILSNCLYPSFDSSSSTVSDGK
jgi:hypothetical protein